MPAAPQLPTFRVRPLTEAIVIDGAVVTQVNSSFSGWRGGMETTVTLEGTASEEALNALVNAVGQCPSPSLIVHPGRLPGLPTEAQTWRKRALDAEAKVRDLTTERNNLKERVQAFAKGLVDDGLIEVDDDAWAGMDWTDF